MCFEEFPNSSALPGHFGKLFLTSVNHSLCKEHILLRHQLQAICKQRQFQEMSCIEHCKKKKQVLLNKLFS